MIAKYRIEFAIEYGGHKMAQPHSHQTDDPVACEEFLVALLDNGLRITGLWHEGLELTGRDFDAMVRHAATALAAQHVARSLGLNAEQVHYRFGLAA